MLAMQCGPKNILAAEKKIFAKKLHKLSKIVKPLLKLFSRRVRTNSITPSSCNYDIESIQNEINENEPFHLQFTFHEEDNNLNEALEARLRESVTTQCPENFGIQAIVDGDITVVHPVLPGTYFAVPVHFVADPVNGGFQFAPVPDADLARHQLFTEAQLPSQQVPSNSATIMVC